jgi:hypothetical protein
MAGDDLVITAVTVTTATVPIVNVMARRIESLISLCSLPCRGQKKKNGIRVKYSEIIADNLKKLGWSWGCVSAVDSNG